MKRSVTQAQRFMVNDVYLQTGVSLPNTQIVLASPGSNDSFKPTYAFIVRAKSCTNGSGDCQYRHGVPL